MTETHFAGAAYGAPDISAQEGHRLKELHGLNLVTPRSEHAQFLLVYRSDLPPGRVRGKLDALSTDAALARGAAMKRVILFSSTLLMLVAASAVVASEAGDVQGVDDRITVIEGLAGPEAVHWDAQQE
ncbi:MAG: hypothetical protein KGY48_09855, partial [Wenzhouxiangellaceae bacterium]|nr:hypothetical protein [Wenzhouxiangellaceae bacterium]